MRLIDADELVRKWEDDANHMDDTFAKCFCYAAINDVKHAPTADVPDRKVGEWIRVPGITVDGEYYPSRLQCSECRHYITVGDDKNFCPNCGAEMRKEKR